ncbi:hypothetical protein E4U54_005157 [Claviceps lovelessii]|nr:hypothetical protein E4U54_005157 [Claviceps lovelessii]
MTPKPKPKLQQTHHQKHHDNPRRLALGAYLSQPPSSFPPNTIIFQTPDFVAIHDKYPKSTIHTLLLPRSPAHNLLHPFEAFRDPLFLQQVQQQVRYLETLVARELQRRLGRYSLQERARQAVLDGADVPDGPPETSARDETGHDEAGHDEASHDETSHDKTSHDGNNINNNGHLPPGRDWQVEVLSGVHAVPSMSHLHIHVLSRDMHSEAMRHRKHYNSFTTGFLVDVMDFPLRDGDAVSSGRGRFLDSELTCWRCGRGFGNRFKMLKEHLEEEFVSWRSL